MKPMLPQHQVLAHVNQDAMIALASALIRLPRLTTEEAPVAQCLADFVRSRGYHVDLQEIDAGRFSPIATLKGTGDGEGRYRVGPDRPGRVPSGTGRAGRKGLRCLIRSRIERYNAGEVFVVGAS